MAKRFLLALIVWGAAAHSQNALSQTPNNRPYFPQPKAPDNQGLRRKSGVGKSSRDRDRLSSSRVSRTPSAGPPDSSLSNRQADPGATRSRKKSSWRLLGYDGLGAAFYQKARETGDITYYDLAEQTLQKSLDLVPQDFRAADPLVHMCLVYMGEHRFADVIVYAQKAIALGSGNLAAFAVEGDAYTDMGDYDQAAAAYNTVQTLGGATSSPLGLAYMLDSRKAYSELSAR